MHLKLFKKLASPVKTFLRKCKGYLKNEKYFLRVKGYCNCCEQKVLFQSKHVWLRDHFLCSNCGCIPRERALMQVVELLYPNWRELSIHESSSCGRGASAKMKAGCKNYTSSQYYPDKKIGDEIYGERNVNLEERYFRKESFDLFITQDVLEHLDDWERTLAEIKRTLKKGGAHIFTVAMVNKDKKTERWGYYKDGKINFLKEPEYHGNPIDESGSPVTFHFGHDLPSLIKEKMDMPTTVYYIDDMEKGIRAEYIEVFASIKM